MADIFDLFRQIQTEKNSHTPPEFIVAGLGNPGDKYIYTRHNAGFMAVDYMMQAKNFECKKLKFKALTGECSFSDKRALIMKPQTFMNASGEAVIEAVNFYKIPSENVIVIQDDVALDVGRIRIRRNGSDGGQKGIRSIIENLGTDKFLRIKIGVGKKPHPDMELADWVLGNFSDDDKKTIFNVLGAVTECVDMLICGKVEEAMGKFNGMVF